MKKILTLFVKYPFYGTTAIVVLILLGFLSLNQMKKATFPLVESKMITVSVSYPGATPKEMDEGVTSLIENSIRGIVGIKEFSSQSRENSASVTITALNGYDMDELLSDVKNAVDGISNFPTNAERPIVSKGRATDMAMFVALYSTSDEDPLKLNEMANRIEDDFLASGKISQVDVRGLPSNLELVIEASETQLKRYDLTLSELRTAVANNNLDVSGGTVRNPREEIKVIARKKSIEPKDIEQIVVRANTNGSVIRVGDVAQVRMQIPESPSVSYVDKKPAATFRINRLGSEDLEEISIYVNRYMESFNAKNNGYHMQMKMNFLDRINGQLDILINNGVIGVILVILMLSLLLNFRLSLWVAWGIPAAFLGMFVVAQTHDLTLNLVSLFGMILIIGILVDDGVVIGENIFTHFEMGKSPRRAAIEGTMEVLPAIFASVTTTIVAFMPILFIEGNMEMMHDMAYVVIVCLAVSLFEAIFVLPGHLANPRVLSHPKKDSFYGKLRGSLDAAIDFVKQRMYKPVLFTILRHKVLTIITVTSLVVITFGMVASNIITYTFFPRTPSTTFTVDLALKPGVSEDVTRETIFKISDAVWAVNEKTLDKTGDEKPYVTSVQVRMGTSFSGAERGTHAAQIRVFLSSSTEWDTSITDQYLKRAIAKEVGELPEAYKFTVGASNRFGAPVSISLLGYDDDELEAAREELSAELKKMPALFNVTDNSQVGSQELRITLKPQAYALGCTTSSLLQQVRTGFYGGLAQRIQHGKDEIWVYVRYSKEDRMNIGQLEKMTIKTSAGNFPLGTLADISAARSLSKINHYNGQREIRVEAYQKDKTQSVPVLLSYIEEKVMPSILERHDGVQFQHQGQSKDTGEQMGSLFLYFGIAFLIIILIVVVYFKSYNQGLMVIGMIPFGIIGAIWGHGIHGEPLSMMTLWGMVALSGVIINDAIVFMARFNQNIERGLPVYDAIVEAGISRFRPILLTTVTTVAGLMPLILENNPDAAMLVPMSIALAYGILFGTFFILVLLPVLLALNNRMVFNWHRLVHRDEEATYESVEPAIKYLKIDQTLEANMAKEIEEDPYHD